MWVDMIKKNAESFARAAVSRSGEGTPSTKGGGIFSTLKAGFSNRRGSAMKDAVEPPRESRPSTSRISMSGLGFTRLSRSGSDALGSISRGSIVEEDFIPDDELDSRLNAMASTLGLVGPQLAAVLKLPKEQKREMLRGFRMKQEESGSAKGPGPKAYVEKLTDDPSFDELMEVAAWLTSAEIAKVGMFADAGGTDALAGVLENLCRSGARGDSDAVKIEAAMRCLSALVKTEAGLNAVINSRKLVCQAFASGRLAPPRRRGDLLTPAVKVLSPSRSSRRKATASPSTRSTSLL